MYTGTYMSGKSIHKIMEEIYSILKKENELSIRQLSLQVKSQWMYLLTKIQNRKILQL